MAETLPCQGTLRIGDDDTLYVQGTVVAKPLLCPPILLLISHSDVIRSEAWYTFNNTSHY